MQLKIIRLTILRTHKKEEWKWEWENSRVSIRRAICSISASEWNSPRSDRYQSVPPQISRDEIPKFRYSDAGSIGSERRWDCSCQESNRSRHSPSSLLVLHLPSLIFVQLRKKYLVAKFRCRISIFMRGTINRIVPNSCILRETRIPLADDCQIKWVKRRSG